MTEVPPLRELERDSEEWRRLSRQIRAEQRERWGRWYFALRPLIVVYATAFMLLRWIVRTAFLVVLNVLAFATAILRALIVVPLAVIAAPFRALSAVASFFKGIRSGYRGE